MKRVVIAGGGYGGLRAIEKLIGTHELELVLIDANNYHFLQTEIYGYIAGTKDIDEIAIDLGLWCRGFKRRVIFIKDRILGLEPQNRVLILENRKIEYDYLIIATGAKTRFPDSIKGLREYCYGIKQLGRSFKFRHRFESVIKRKLEGEREKINIVVIGAGLSGVEVAAEMGYMLKRYEKMLGERAEDIEITLVDACKTILPGLHPYLIESASKRLEELGVKVKCSAFICSIDKKEIHLKDGGKIGYSFTIFTGGIAANSDFVPENFGKNDIGQLIVRPSLNIENHEEIFAIGDVAQIEDLQGHILPPTAQIAEKSAEYVAKYIRNDLKGIRTNPFRAKMDGMFIALGGRYGTAELFGCRFSGVGAYYMKRLITLIYYFGINLRANAGYKIRKP